MPPASSVLAACGGFLLAVLWMDLMFDVQVLRHPRARGELPEPVLASIAAYYRRVTTTASPMSHLIGAVMAVTVIALVVEIGSGIGPRWRIIASVALGCGPIALAILRVFPNAVRLGARSGSTLEQSALARSICTEHLLCCAGIVGLVALQLSLAAR